MNTESERPAPVITSLSESIESVTCLQIGACETSNGSCIFLVNHSLHGRHFPLSVTLNVLVGAECLIWHARQFQPYLVVLLELHWTVDMIRPDKPTTMVHLEFRKALTCASKS